MPQSYGRQILSSAGDPIQVAADGAPEWKAGGITIDWSTISAVGSDTTLTDGNVIKNGQKGLEFGTILCKITTREVQTVTITGTPTGGTFTLTLTRNGVARTTAAIAYNASAAVVQAALEALDNLGVGNVQVTGGPLPGTAVTVTFIAAAGAEDVAQMTATGSFTGGTTPAVTVATTSNGTASYGKYGPYSSGATDGRQSLNRGDCVILNQTVLETPGSGLVGAAVDHPAVIEGGLVWKARLKVGGSGQPALSTFESAFPRIRYVNQY